MDMYTREAEKIIARALAEDVGAGDITTASTVPDGRMGAAVVVAKERFVLAGMDVFARVFKTLDGRVRVIPNLEDGDRVKKGATVASLEGPLRALLTGERVALNLLQRMSGIATLTARYVRMARGTGVKILDTRKTTPGLRMLEKYAVTAGGGVNHRLGLYDMALIKDNHIAAAGGISKAVRSVRRALPDGSRLEVECGSLDDVREAVGAGADIIMLDNMGIREMRAAVKLVSGRAEVEASGNMTPDRVGAVARTGVEFISVGALTHSAPAVDISMRVTGRVRGSGHARP